MAALRARIAPPLAPAPVEAPRAILPGPIPEAAIIEAIARGLSLPEGVKLEPGEWSVRGRALIDLDCVVSRAVDRAWSKAELRQLVSLSTSRLLGALLERSGVAQARWPALVRMAAQDASTKEPTDSQRGAVAVAVAAVDEVRDELAAALPTPKDRNGACQVRGAVLFNTFNRS